MKVKGWRLNVGLALVGLLAGFVILVLTKSEGQQAEAAPATLASFQGERYPAGRDEVRFLTSSPTLPNDVAHDFCEVLEIAANRQLECFGVEAALESIESLGDKSCRDQVVTRLIRKIANADIYRAIELAHSIQDEESRGRCLLEVAAIAGDSVLASKPGPSISVSETVPRMVSDRLCSLLPDIYDLAQVEQL